MHFGRALLFLKKKYYGQYGRASLVNHYDPIGMTEAEIQTLMQRQEVTFLPRIYREYLETMGNRDVLFSGLGGSSMETLGEMKDFCRYTAAVEKTPHDFSDVFCFLQYQSGGCNLFYISEKEEDPIVYSWEAAPIVYQGRGHFAESSLRLQQFFLNSAVPRQRWDDASVLDEVPEDI